MLEARPDSGPSGLVAALADAATFAERSSAVFPAQLAAVDELAADTEQPVLLLRDVSPADVDALVSGYGARLVKIDPGREIPGSYWGESEAGLIEYDVFVRADTPVHSLLHELCHFICMDPARRAKLVTDAGGDDAEECAVCYLEVLLADEIAGFGRERCLADMNRWGYSFREGSADRWFAGDGEEARVWLLEHGLIDAASVPTYELRG